MAGFTRSKVPPTFGTDIKELQDRWYQSIGTPEHAEIDRQLSAAIWRKAEQRVAEDRAKHPKAKRNSPVIRTPPVEMEAYDPREMDAK